jgi:Zn-dependent peptidase ImmA (M78 family)
MKMIPDKTGRFKERPYWEAYELDEKCEQTITEFLRRRYGFDRIPVPTEALTEIIERDAAELDLKPNLSDDQYEVFGYTQFERGRKPRVIVARELWERRYRNNRLRMVLGHEYGHVLLHTWFYDKYGPTSGPQRCHWQDLLPTERVVDWAEWHAGYAGGAFLMPETFLRRAVMAFFRERSERPPARRGSADASALSERIALTFDVSVEAATVRLSQRGFLRD